MKFHSYVFLTANGNNLSGKAEFLKLLESKKVVVSSFATVGLKINTSILFWLQSESLEEIQDLVNKLMHTKLGKNLIISQTLLGLTRPTQYSPESRGHLATGRKGKKYLVIYPFTKTKDWYQLTFEKRKKLMWGHVQIGKKHPEIEQILLYSYGIDNSEFIVSYETDDLFEFQTLVMELRTDAVRMYTQSDTPIYTCIYKPLNKILDYL